jgi:hypothetical protein
MLDSTENLIISDLWVAFHAKRWWNLFELILDRCCVKERGQIVKYDFELLEYAVVTEECTKTYYFKRFF